MKIHRADLKKLTKRCMFHDFVFVMLAGSTSCIQWLAPKNVALRYGYRLCKPRERHRTDPEKINEALHLFPDVLFVILVGSTPGRQCVTPNNIAFRCGYLLYKRFSNETRASHHMACEINTKQLMDIVEHDFTTNTINTDLDLQNPDTTAIFTDTTAQPTAPTNIKEKNWRTDIKIHRADREKIHKTFNGSMIVASSCWPLRGQIPNDSRRRELLYGMDTVSTSHIAHRNQQQQIAPLTSLITNWPWPTKIGHQQRFSQTPRRNQKHQWTSNKKMTDGYGNPPGRPRENWNKLSQQRTLTVEICNLI